MAKGSKFSELDQIGFVGKRSATPPPSEPVSPRYPPITPIDELQSTTPMIHGDARTGVHKVPHQIANNGLVRNRPAPKLLAGTRGKSESPNAVIACNDWLRMGVSRSVMGLYRIYKARDPNFRKSPQTFHNWSWDYSWAARAEEYDTKMEARKNKIVDDQMNTLLTGLSAPQLRVEKLKKLAQLLEEEVSNPNRLYIPDIKQIGTGAYAREVETIKFNSALVDQYRAVLDDIAKETGGRVKPGASDNVPIHINVNLKELEEATSVIGLPGPTTGGNGWHPSELEGVLDDVSVSDITPAAVLAEDAEPTIELLDPLKKKRGGRPKKLATAVEKVETVDA